MSYRQKMGKTNSEKSKPGSGAILRKKGFDGEGESWYVPYPRGEMMTKIILVLAFLVTAAQGLTCGPRGLGFLAFGDGGFGTPAQFQTAKAMESVCEKNPCHLALLLGDNFYPDGVSSVSDPQWRTKFEEPYSGLKVPFYPTLGNHDYFGNVQAQIQYSEKSPKWKFPSRFYKFNFCEVDFFIIDAERFDESQKNWLEEALSTSKAKWKIVAGHRPIYSHGGHGNSKLLKKELLPLLRDRVDFYFAGHDHHLEHISKNYRPEFIISGAVAESRGVESGESTVFASESLGFVYVQVTPSTTTFRYFDDQGQSIFTRTKKKTQKKIKAQ